MHINYYIISRKMDLLYFVWSTVLWTAIIDRFLIYMKVLWSETNYCIQNLLWHTACMVSGQRCQSKSWHTSKPTWVCNTKNWISFSKYFFRFHCRKSKFAQFHCIILGRLTLSKTSKKKYWVIHWKEFHYIYKYIGTNYIVLSYYTQL